MNTVAFIFARGGSKGLPGKNIRLLHGKPLIAWAIEQAQAVEAIARVVVSTDSADIAAVAQEYGAEVPFMRPAELARDNSPEWLAWQHALDHLRIKEGVLPEIMLSIPPTAPLRAPLDIENCLHEFQQGNCDVVITVTESQRSPYFNMVKMQPDGTVGLVNPPPSTINRRQDVPPVYDVTTVAYAASPEFVLANNGIFAGRVKAVQVPRERALDIDTLLDFQLAECLIQIAQGENQ